MRLLFGAILAQHDNAAHRTPTATSMPTKRQTLAALASLAAAPFAGAQAWPSAPLKVLVGFPPGSTPDLAARSISDGLAAALGQPVVIENRPGASGNIAADLVAKARDDHTVGVMINGNLTVAKLLNPANAFDPAKDFAPVSLIGTAPLVLVAAGSASGSTPQELLAWARGLGGQANYGTPGNGTVGHLGMELIAGKTGLAPVHVPFAGNPQVINAMVGGQVQLALLPPGLAMPQVRAGRLKAIAVTASVRSGLVPDLPTLREIGVAGAELEVWTAMAAPSTMAPARVAKLSEALVATIRSAPVRQRLLDVGWQAAATSPEGLANRMKADAAVLAAIIKARGIRSDS